jgi:hypothetical protein
MADLIRRGLISTASIEEYALSWVDSLEALRSRQKAEVESQHDAYLAEKSELENLIDQQRQLMGANVSPSHLQQCMDSTLELMQRLTELNITADIKETRRKEAHQQQLLEHFTKYSQQFPQAPFQVSLPQNCPVSSSASARNRMSHTDFTRRNLATWFQNTQSQNRGQYGLSLPRLPTI